MRGRELAESLLKIGLREDEVVRAFNIYSTRLIMDCFLYFHKQGHRFIFGRQFFAMLNHMAALKPTTDIAQVLKRGGGKIQKQRTPDIMEILSGAVNHEHGC